MRQDRDRRAAPERDPAQHARVVHAQRRELVREALVEARALRREHRGERVVRGLRDRRLERRVVRRAAQADVAPVAAVDRVHRFEHGDLHDRDRAARAARSDLLAEHAVLADGDGRVVEAARVDRDPVPAPHDVEPAVGSGTRDARRAVGRAFEAWTERVAHTVAELVGARGSGGSEREPERGQGRGEQSAERSERHGGASSSASSTRARGESVTRGTRNVPRRTQNGDSDHPSSSRRSITDEKMVLPVTNGTRPARSRTLAVRGSSRGRSTMVKLWYAPQTRAIRVVWLLEELGLPYTLERVEFAPTSNEFFIQKTPLGKLPVLEDDGVLMCESGAIVEYLLERYGNGRLSPPVGSPKRAEFLQWLHFAESTAFPPLGIVFWLTRYRGDSAQYETLIADSRARAASGLEFLERQLGAKAWLLGDAFSAADVMMGFTLVASRMAGVLDARFPALDAYLGRLQGRPAFQRTLAVG